MPDQQGEGLKTNSCGVAGAFGSLETVGKKTLSKKKNKGRYEKALLLMGRKKDHRAGRDQPLHVIEKKTRS